MTDPSAGTVGMSPEQLRESRAYGRRDLACTLADMALDVLYLGGFALFGAGLLDHWLDRWAWLQNPWFRLLAFYVVILGLHLAISFPLSLYSGHVLEHQYGLSRQSLGRWLKRYVLKNLLTFGFGLLMIVGLYAIIWWTGRWWWLVAAGATFVVTAVLGQLVPVLILPLFYKIERLEDAELAARFARLVQRTTLRLEGIYRLQLSDETAKANAMLAGLGRTRRVLLGDTLLSDYSPTEIEVILAHEVGHHVHHHITKLILFGLVYSGASYFVCDLALRRWMVDPQIPFSYADVPPSSLSLILFVITSFSLLLSPLRSGLSRFFEVQADRYALHATGNANAYRSAFSKLARQNKADPDPPTLEVLLLHDHPPIAARLRLADEFAHQPRS